jgi:hypothetical protein
MYSRQVSNLPLESCHQPLRLYFVFEIVSLTLFSWPWIYNLPTSISQLTGITGMCHQCPAQVYQMYADFDSFEYMPRIGTTGSYGSPIFNFLRNLHTDSHNDWTNLYSYQQQIRALPRSLTSICFCFCSWW